MSLSSHEIKEAQDLLGRILSPRLMEIIKAVEEPPGPNNPFFIEIPHADYLDLTAEDLASLVARTSNRYQSAIYHAGIARSEFKQAEARYKLKYKRNLHGKNPGEREANALTAAEDEFVALSLIESIVALAEAQEMAAKVANESSKKLFDKVQSINVANARGAKGEYRDSDYTTQGNW